MKGNNGDATGQVRFFPVYEISNTPNMITGKEVHGVNARRLMYRLQAALCAKGICVRINQRQTWIECDGRKVAVSRFTVVDDANKTIVETYKAIDVVKALAELRAGGDKA